MTSIEAPSISRTENIPGRERDIDSLKDSLIKVTSALSGQKVNESQVAGILSEDLLYAANVYQQLRGRDEALAREFLDNLPKRYERRVGRSQRQPLFKAVDSFLARNMKNGRLSRADRREITREAFGNAQLDSRPRKLAMRSHTGAAGASLDDVLSRGLNAEPADRAAMKTFRQRADGKVRSENTLEYLKTRFNLASDNSMPPTELDTGMHEFVFSPASVHDKNAVVFLPIKYANDVKAVGIFNSEGQLVAELKASGKHSDGRTIWRHSSPGQELKDIDSIRMIFHDNGMLEYPLAGNGFQTRGVL